jgi:putative ABC transport system substrate-binding protein
MEITAKRLQFSSFILDLDRLCLFGLSGGASLRPKSFDVLRYLVEHPRRVVTKDELIKAVWPNVIVTDESLTRCISDVRHALGDASQQVIKTVPKRGYLLDLEVSVLDIVTGAEPERIKAGTPDDFFPTEGPIVGVFPSTAINGESGYANRIRQPSGPSESLAAPIGVLMNRAADDPEARVLVGAFSQGLAEAGWIIGRNARIDYRWYQGAEAARAYAAELLALTPDIILASGTPGTTAVKQLTRTVPIVFTRVAGPVGSGIVDSLARPGGNITGFMAFEFSFGGKSLDHLKEIAPHVSRVAVFRDETNPAGIAQFGVIQAMATSAGMQVTPVSVRNSDEIASAVEAFARSPNGGAIVTGYALTTGHRDLILKLIARYKLPAIYQDRVSVANGGLISYGPDFADQFRRAAGYVDRILKGEKPGDLPVQAPTKYELVINLKTAKALGLTVPQSLLASADEVIE